MKENANSMELLGLEYKMKLTVFRLAHFYKIKSAVFNNYTELYKYTQFRHGSPKIKQQKPK